jgi:SAM-dependent methyltransferase
VDCLNEGFFIYHAFKSLYEQYAGEIAQCEQVLDFGCGWGRISRFFLKDLEPSRLLGVDPIAEYLAVCQQTNRWQRFQQIPCHPPTDLPVETFDWIYSFSVFSHLSETMHEQVLRELHRLLKPGGLLTVTTHQREMITFCQELRDDERVRQAWPDSVNASMASFLDQERTLADYDNGRYCYSSLNLPDEWSYWGDAAIPEGYVREHWTRLFHFVEFVSDPNRAPQNVIVMRK